MIIVEYPQEKHNEIQCPKCISDFGFSIITDTIDIIIKECITIQQSNMAATKTRDMV
jgi:hypothetical protein